MLESIVHITDCCAVSLQFLCQRHTATSVRIADGFCIEDTGDLTAVGTQFNGVEQMAVAMGEGRIHENQAVTLAGEVVEKIVMDHAVALADQDGAQIRIKLYTVHIIKGSAAVIALFAVTVTALLGEVNEVAHTGAGLQHGVHHVPINCGQQLPGKLRRRRVELAVCRLGSLPG